MSRYKLFFISVAVVALSGLIEVVFGPIDQFLAQLSPISIWKLPSHALPAIAMTIAASIFSWCVAVVCGGALGLMAASGQLAERNIGLAWKTWGKTAAVTRRLYNWIFVVPLVLTIIVAVNITKTAELEGRLSSWAVPIVLVSVTGIALAGQRIFIAVDDAVDQSDTDDILVAKSLMLSSGTAEGRLARLRRVLQETRFLLGCKIALLAQALEQAFHLAVVGVVILETVSGLWVYAELFSSPTSDSQWVGGIGRLILSSQQGYQPAITAGAVYLILLIDTGLAWAIRSFVYRRWVEPYKRVT